ncbi:MAG TPA: aldose 1-epimerase [Phenylobacterium sp.]
MAGGLLIGGAPAATLRAEPQADGTGFVEATVLPGRGFMLLQAVMARPSGERVEAIQSPTLEAAAAALNGGPDDFAGNGSFRFGGAILAPFANRIRGRARDDAREIEAAIDGRLVHLPRNWGGKAPGAEQYAMHGLILATPVPWTQPRPDRLQGVLEDVDFGGRWPGRARLAFEWRLEGGELRLRVEARNLGPVPLPIGLGWHPYFRLPSGDRRQARLTVPARQRTEVNDYDEVLPTGRILDVAGTAYDFRGAGRALGDLYLDDCFTGLAASGGSAVTEILDPAAGLGLRIAAPCPPVRAIQVYAPPTDAFVVVEPQYNLADPFGAEWPPGVDTGMVRLPPGATTLYEVAVTPFEA